VHGPEKKDQACGGYLPDPEGLEQGGQVIVPGQGAEEPVDVLDQE
jgi:hypothetical protein